MNWYYSCLARYIQSDLDTHEMDPATAYHSFHAHIKRGYRVHFHAREQSILHIRNIVLDPMDGE